MGAIVATDRGHIEALTAGNLNVSIGSASAMRVPNECHGIGHQLCHQCRPPFKGGGWQSRLAPRRSIRLWISRQFSRALTNSRKLGA